VAIIDGGNSHLFIWSSSLWWVWNQKSIYTTKIINGSRGEFWFI